MKGFIRLIAIFLCLVSVSLVFPQKAHAYLDPGTGSYILQLLIAALIGAIFAVKLFWNNIKIFLKRLFYKGKRHE